MHESPPPPATTSPPSTGTLFFAFLRLGLTAFGGPAMVAYIKELAITKNQWLSEGSFKQGVAICQVIPGATAMQVAAYIGLRAGGPFGAITAYIGFGLPAFLLMVFLAAFYQSAQEYTTVLSIFSGLQVIVIALVANATLNFGKGSIKGWQDTVLALGITAYLVLQGNPLLAISAAALAGLFLHGKKPEQTKGTMPAPPAALADLATPLLLTLALIGGMAVLFFSDRRLFDLSLVMVKVDLFAFGGGYGSVPLMFSEVVDGRKWLDGKTFLDGIALGQVTPGPIVITATFVGYLLAFLPGALIATISILTPSLIMLTLAVPYFDRIEHNKLFQKAMHGIVVSFVGLLLSVTLRFIPAVPWATPQLAFVVSAFVALRLKIDILWVVLVGGGLSALIL